MERALADVMTVYTDNLIRSGELQSDAVERAFRRVRRHRFLDHWYRLEASRLQAVWHRVDFDRDNPDMEALSAIYSARSLVTGVDGYRPTTSTSDPRLTARMLELLNLEPGMRVLEIGTGTGYNAALLAETIGNPGDIFTVEIRESVAARARDALRDEGYAGIHVIHRDGALGAEEGAPFDRIEVTAGCTDIAPIWLEQLAPNGRLLVPIQHGHLHPLLQIRRADESRTAEASIVGKSSFMSITGQLDGPNSWQSFLLGGVPQQPAWTRGLPTQLPPCEGHPLADDEHRSFYFFLTLSSRELWQTNAGYGLADPLTGDIVVFTSERCEGFTRGRGHGEWLHERLLRLLCAWDDLGRPKASDYEIEFIPRVVIPQLTDRGRGEWVIERTYHWQVVRL